MRNLAITQTHHRSWQAAVPGHHTSQRPVGGPTHHAARGDNVTATRSRAIGSSSAFSRGRNRRRLSSALVALAAISMAAGCSSSDGDKAATPPNPSSAKPTKIASADEARARKDVITAYRGMTDEQVKAYAKGSLSDSKITEYSTGKALRDVKNDVFINMQNGIVSKGEPKVIASESDVEVNLDSTPKTATLRLCFDQNTWTPIDKKTGKSVAPPNQVKRYTINAHLENQGDRWRVTDEKANKERRC